MIAAKTSLKQMLKHLKELADKQLSKSKEFDDALNEYRTALIECSDRSEIHDALNYLKTIDSLGMLNLWHMKEELECH